MIGILNVVFDGPEPPGEEVQGEVDSGDEHEDDGDEFDGDTVEIPETLVVSRETADGDRAECVANGIERAHAGKQIGQRTEHRDAQVDIPERLRRLGDPRRQPGILDRSGRLRAVQLHAAHTQHGQHRHGEHDDAQPPEPLQLLAVE